MLYSGGIPEIIDLIIKSCILLEQEYFIQKRGIHRIDSNYANIHLYFSLYFKVKFNMNNPHEGKFETKINEIYLFMFYFILH